eukprot:1692988-Rhodomonas_salina.1
MLSAIGMAFAMPASCPATHPMSLPTALSTSRTSIESSGPEFSAVVASCAGVKPTCIGANSPWKGPSLAQPVSYAR